MHKKLIFGALLFCCIVCTLYAWHGAGWWGSGNGWNGGPWTSNKSHTNVPIDINTNWYNNVDTNAHTDLNNDEWVVRPSGQWRDEEYDRGITQGYAEDSSTFFSPYVPIGEAIATGVVAGELATAKPTTERYTQRHVSDNPAYYENDEYADVDHLGESDTDV